MLKLVALLLSRSCSVMERLVAYVLIFDLETEDSGGKQFI